MAKAKRMSDIFASSAEKDTSAGAATATPPYSSEGPTLPLIDGDSAIKETNSNAATTSKASEDSTSRKRKLQHQNQSGHATTSIAVPATVHSALYKPWTLLSVELLKSLKSQGRMREMQNIVPVIISRNQNIKAGINRLKTCLGAHKDNTNPIEMPAGLKPADAMIALSAQGEGTAKLISILDVVRRVVAPAAIQQEGSGSAVTWWLYLTLTSVEAERKSQTGAGGRQASSHTQETEDADAFEPIDVEQTSNGDASENLATRKIPVLTAWMTKKRVSAFAEAFGEQTFTVQTLPSDE
ncbi:hypothetical protein EK21DRAFT_96840 [Setomelanomma holmii]|uniref:Uncharacterized protein n=1 Tax=Setomelanomma holmii TaxID=210430 RepID=A0A9P4HJZ6_9PLEO|nr:hypothetical protein EK21DRAFT_96840 [Setomelanomma holmii]